MQRLGSLLFKVHLLTSIQLNLKNAQCGSKGTVSGRSDGRSYGILLMETFMRKKPTDEMFPGAMSLKKWVK